MGLALLGSSSENRNSTETQNVSGGADGNGFNLSTNNSDVNVLDGGAIEALASITYKALENEGNTSQNALVANMNALEFAQKAGRPEADVWNNQTYVMGAVVVVVLFFSMNKKSKGKK